MHCCTKEDATPPLLSWLRSRVCATDIYVSEQEEDKPADTYSESAWRMVKHGAWVVWDGAVASLRVCMRAQVCSLRTTRCLHVVTGMEFVGEVCADFLGLNDSQYQWIIDEHRRREAEVCLCCSLSRPATARLQALRAVWRSGCGDSGD